MQTATHDQVSKLFQALLADAGWDDVKEEDKWWDTDAPGPGWGHRRPDITAMHPSTGVKHVFDVMIRCVDSIDQAPRWTAIYGQARGQRIPEVKVSRVFKSLKDE